MGKFSKSLKDAEKKSSSSGKGGLYPQKKMANFSQDPFASKKAKSKHSNHQKNKPPQNHKNNSNASVKPILTKTSQYDSPPSPSPSSPSSMTIPKKGLSALQEKFAKKLQGSRFRALNEGIYTTSGSESLESFQKNPELFEIYHAGFREQANKWPENPLNSIISWIKKMDQNVVVADMGCGDARLAQSVKQKVHSFDLVSTNKWVTAADIAHVPLGTGSVDVVVFCLSLMGTNIGDFILEAHRILKVGGIMRIVEVRSRFEKEADGIKKFIRTVKKAGFSLSGNERDSAINTMFFLLECRKAHETTARPGDVVYSAQPCVYKKR